MMKNVMTLSLLLLACVSGFAATVKELKVENLRTPLGIDTETPHFSWQLESDVRGCRQISYQIVVRDESGAEVWNTGSVTGEEQYGIAYAGSPLTSNSAYAWTLRVQTTDGTAEASSSFETAFLDASQWTGKWIGEGVEETLSKYEITFDTPVRARYLRLNVTALGLRASTDAGYSFVQLDEVEVYVGDENVALSATVTASNTWSLPQYGWDISFVNDGKIKDVSRNGWTTQQNPSTPVTLDLDLKEEMDVDRIVLYPRQNDHAVGDATKAANFPASFSILGKLQTGSYAVKYLANNIDAPTFPTAGRHVPVFARNFSVHGDVKRARIYASALGVFTMKLNGQRVTDAVLEPGESEYEKTILYSTYDVTNLLQEGANTLLAEVAGGIYNIDYLTGRFSKGEVTNNGTTALIAELLIDYADGTSERIVTDDTWRSKSGPTLGSNWWGGEDYDARLQIPGIGSAGLDLSQWGAVSIVTPHFQSPHSGVSGHGVLRSRMYEPLRVVEEWKAVSVKTISSGGYTLRMIDFGRNFAGQYRFRLKGTPGQKISLRCGESLNPDGSIYMENFYTGPADTYEEYTFRGDEEGEEWGPEFMYHGFRYLQIIGLDEEPEASAFTAMRIRSAMDNVGSVVTSNSLINDIHVICRDAIASQLYNSITDCPHREKLGWLDVPNEMYVSLSSNFNMQNFYKKVVLDCFDAQQSNGWVPSVAPFYMNVYGDDTNWGGAAILVPYRNWRYYGDKSLMEEYYPKMKLLMSHYAENTSGYLIKNSFSVLSDWGQETAGVSPMVPTEFTETTTYYYLAVVMAEMAAELGYTSDVTAYSELAANIKQAFNNRFYDSATGVYTSISGGGGRQSEQAMPLYYGLVPEGDEEKVCEVLAERVRLDGYKIKTGEIALKCVFMSLAQYGHDDIVWQMANQTDCPSYGYWVVQGYTTTPEYWDVGAFSQNHCMMDHIEEWFFTRLGGIQNTGMAFSTLRIAPFIPAGLKSSDVSTETSYGTVRSSWNRDGDRMQYSFDVPFGTVATIVVPCGASQHLAEGGEPLTEGYDGVISVSYGADKATVVCGGGSYLWETLVGAPPTSSDITDTYIKNAGFEQRNTGTAPWSPTYWNLTFPEGTGYGGIQSDQRNVNTKEGTYDWHIWYNNNYVSNRLYQTISDLPAGYYLLTGYMRCVDNLAVTGQQRLFATVGDGVINESTVYSAAYNADGHIDINNNDNENINNWEKLSVDFTVAETGNVTIGFDCPYVSSRTTQGFQVDDVRLYVKSSAFMAVDPAVKYGTFCAPFEVEPPTGVTAYTCAETEESTLTLEEVNPIPANTPVILYAEDGCTSTEFKGVREGTSEIVNWGLLYGNVTDAAQYITDTGHEYILQRQDGVTAFYKIEGSGYKVGANRCYLQLPPESSARLAFYLDEDDDPTSVTSIPDSRINKTFGDGTYIINGRVVVVKSGVKYSLNGQIIK